MVASGAYLNDNLTIFFETSNKHKNKFLKYGNTYSFNNPQLFLMKNKSL